MWETAPEVRSVHVGAAFLWDVDVLALRTVALHTGVLQVLAHADWEDGLTLAKHAWTGTEVAGEELLPHHGEALRGKDVSRVDETVEIDGFLVQVQESEIC